MTGLRIPIPGSPPARMTPYGYEGPRQTDTTLETYYCAGQCNATALTTGAPAINTIHAMPLILPRGGWIDLIVFRVTTGAVGSVARMGIYLPYSRSNILPSKLLFNGDEKTTTANNTSHPTSVSFYAKPGELYWFAYNCGTAAPTIRCLALAGCYPLTGMSNSMPTTPAVGFTAVSTYGALPMTFPSASRLAAVPVPALFYRLAQ